MGNLFSGSLSGSVSSLFSTMWQLGRRKEARFVMVGLDAAGKTTILYKLKLNEHVHSIPTVGFNVETLDYKNLSMTIWDIGGQDIIRPLWRHYYENTQGVIFVVDSNDVERVGGSSDRNHEASARDELHRLLADDHLRGAAILVLANKQDLPGALSVSQVAERLELNKIRGHEWFIQGSSAQTGHGLHEGLEWLSKHLPKA